MNSAEEHPDDEGRKVPKEPMEEPYSKSVQSEFDLIVEKLSEAVTNVDYNCSYRKVKSGLEHPSKENVGRVSCASLSTLWMLRHKLGLMETRKILACTGSRFFLPTSQARSFVAWCFEQHDVTTTALNERASKLPMTDSADIVTEIVPKTNDIHASTNGSASIDESKIPADDDCGSVDSSVLQDVDLPFSILEMAIRQMKDVARKYLATCIPMMVNNLVQLSEANDDKVVPKTLLTLLLCCVETFPFENRFAFQDVVDIFTGNFVMTDGDSFSQPIISRLCKVKEIFIENVAVSKSTLDDVVTDISILCRDYRKNSKDSQSNATRIDTLIRLVTALIPPVFGLMTDDEIDNTIKRLAMAFNSNYFPGLGVPVMHRVHAIDCMITAVKFLELVTLTSLQSFALILLRNASKMSLELLRLLEFLLLILEKSGSVTLTFMSRFEFNSLIIFKKCENFRVHLKLMELINCFISKTCHVDDWINMTITEVQFLVDNVYCDMKCPTQDRHVEYLEVSLSSNDIHRIIGFDLAVLSHVHYLRKNTQRRIFDGLESCLCKVFDCYKSVLHKQVKVCLSLVDVTYFISTNKLLAHVPEWCERSDHQRLFDRAFTVMESSMDFAIILENDDMAKACSVWHKWLLNHLVYYGLEAIWVDRLLLKLVKNFEKDCQVGRWFVANVKAMILKLPVSPRVMRRVGSVCVSRYYDPDEKIRDGYREILSCLPLDSTLRTHSAFNFVESCTEGPRAVMRKLLQNIDVKANCGIGLEGTDLKLVWGYLLGGFQVEQVGSIDHSLRNIVKISPRISEVDRKLILLGTHGNEHIVLWYWTIWNTAAHCVGNKFTTVFGDCFKTMDLIEEVLHQTIFRRSSSFDLNLLETEKRSKLFLVFVDSLIKMVNAAISGSSKGIIGAFGDELQLHYQSIRKDWEAWEGHIGLCMAKVATRIRYPEIAVKYLWMTLEKIRKEDRVFEEAIIYLCHAYIQLGSESSVNGLHAWCLENYGLNFKWMPAAEAQANGNFEKAVTLYKSCLAGLGLGEDTNESTTFPTVAEIKFINNSICECLVQLGSWRKLSRWIQDIDHVSTNRNDHLHRLCRHLVSPHHPAVISTLSKFAIPKTSRGVFWECHEELQRSYVEMLDNRCPIIDRDQLWMCMASEAVKAHSLKISRRTSKQISERIFDATMISNVLDPFACIDERFPSTLKIISLLDSEDQRWMLPDVDLPDKHQMSSLNMCSILVAATRQSRDASSFIRVSRALRRRGNETYAYERLKQLNGGKIPLMEGMWSGLQTAKYLMKQDSDEQQSRAVDLIMTAAASPFTYQVDQAIASKLNDIASTSLRMASDWLREDKSGELITKVAPAIELLSAVEVQRLNLHGEAVSQAIVDELSTGHEILIKYLQQYSIIFASTRAKPMLKFGDWCFRRACGFVNKEILNDYDTIIPEGMPNRATNVRLLKEARDKYEATCPYYGSECYYQEVLPVSEEETARACLTRRVAYARIAMSSILHGFSVYSNVKNEKDVHLLTSAQAAVVNLLFMYPESVFDICAANLGILCDSIDAVARWRHYIPQIINRVYAKDESNSKILFTSVLEAVLRYEPESIIYQLAAAQFTECDETVNSLIMSSIEEQMWVNTTTLVRELRRITLLRHELCYGVLRQLHQELATRLKRFFLGQYRLESSHICKADLKTISKERQSIMLDSVVNTLQKMIDITGQPAECCVDEEFLEVVHVQCVEFLSDFKSRMEALRLSAKECMEAYCKLMDTASNFCKKHSNFKLSEISRQMSSLSGNTKIPIPSLKSGQLEVPVLSHIGETVTALRSKTKPKCFVFFDTTGRKHSFLLKGLDDVRQDEAVMQLLGLINASMEKMDRDQVVKYSIRCYPIIPLAPRSALIGMIDSSTSLFTLYTRWMTNQSKRKANDDVASHDGHAELVCRPNELFERKLNDVVVTTNLHAREARQECVKFLISETPSDILSREIWYHSLSPGDWWKMSSNYTRSLAVMSAVGLVVGLGDRHLCNLLIDFTNAQVIHVDYNVCFDKGKQLKTPEVVPFRLTRNLVHPLGISGAEGPFMHDSANVLQHLRSVDHLVLTVLRNYLMEDSCTRGRNVECSTYLRSYNGGLFSSNMEAGDDLPDALFTGAITTTHKQIAFARRLLLLRIQELKPSWDASRQAFNDVFNKISLAKVGYEALRKTNADDIRLLKGIDSLKCYLDDYLDRSNPSGHPFETLRTREQGFKQANQAMDVLLNSLRKQFSDLDIDINGEINSTAGEIRELSTKIKESKCEYPSIGEDVDTSGDVELQKLIKQDESLCHDLNKLIDESLQNVSEACRLMNEFSSNLLHHFGTMEFKRHLGWDILVAKKEEISDFARHQGAQPLEKNDGWILKWKNLRSGLVAKCKDEALHHTEEKIILQQRLMAIEGNALLPFNRTQESVPIAANDRYIISNLACLYRACRDAGQKSADQTLTFLNNNLIPTDSTDSTSLAVVDSTESDRKFECLSIIADRIQHISDAVSHNPYSDVHIPLFRFIRTESCRVIDLASNSVNLIKEAYATYACEIMPQVRLAALNGVVEFPTSIASADILIDQLQQKQASLQPDQMQDDVMMEDSYNIFIDSITDDALNQCIAKIGQAVTTVRDDFIFSYKIIRNMIDGVKVNAYPTSYIDDINMDMIDTGSFLSINLERLRTAEMILTCRVVKEYTSLASSMIPDSDGNSKSEKYVSDADMLEAARQFTNYMIELLLGEYTSLGILFLVASSMEVHPYQVINLQQTIDDYLVATMKHDLQGDSDQHLQTQLVRRQMMISRRTYLQGKERILNKLYEHKLFEHELLTYTSIFEMDASCDVDYFTGWKQYLSLIENMKQKLEQISDHTETFRKVTSLERRIVQKLKWLAAGNETEALTGVKRISARRKDCLTAEQSLVSRAIETMESVISLKKMCTNFKQEVLAVHESFDSINEKATTLRRAIDKELNNLSDVDFALFREMESSEFNSDKPSARKIIQSIMDKSSKIKKRKAENEDHINEAGTMFAQLSKQLSTTMASFSSVGNDVLTHVQYLTKIATSVEIEEFKETMKSFKKVVLCLQTALMTKKPPKLPIVEEYPGVLKRIFDLPVRLADCKMEPLKQLADDHKVVIPWLNLTLRLQGTPSGELMSAEDQMRSAVKEAWKFENLAAMYEGWCAWV